MIKHVSLVLPTLFDIKSFRFEPWQQNKTARFLPLGAMYLAGYLRRHLPEIEYSIFDANVELPLYYRQHPELIGAPDVDAREVMRTILEEYLDEHRPEVIGISGQFHSVQHQFHFLSQVTKECLPGSRIIAGGPYPSGSPKIVLRDRSIDYIITGEGEFRMYNLLRHIQGDIGLECLDGVIYRDGAKQARAAQLIDLPGIERNLDLDHMAYPARDLVRQDEYTGFSSERNADYLHRKDFRVTGIYSSRGCPMRCAYCNSGTANFYGPKFRLESVESVVEEVKFCIENYGIKEMQFYDENITANQRHTYALWTALNELPVNWTFITLELEKLERRSLLEYTKKKKFSWFSVGMESGNDRVLKNVAWRRASRTSMTGQMQILRNVVGENCFISASFIVGFPGENLGEILDTVEFAKTVGIDWAAILCYMPLPGTPLHELCVKEGYLDEATVDYGNIRPEVSVLNTPEWTSTHLTTIRNWANYEVNFVHNHNILDDPRKAIRGFEYVLTVAPNHFFATYALGECYLQVGESEKARKYFDLAQTQVSLPPYCDFVNYFDLPHVGIERQSNIVPSLSNGNGGMLERKQFFVPVA